MSRDYIVYTSRDRVPPLAELQALGDFQVTIGSTAELRELYLEELAVSGESDHGFLAVLDACDTDVVFVARGDQQSVAARVAAITLAARCDGWFSDPQVGGAPVRCR